MRRLYTFKRKEGETLRGYCTRTAKEARTIWKKDEAPFLKTAVLTTRNAPLHGGARRGGKLQSDECEGGSRQSHEMEAQMVLAPSMLCVGQDCFGVVRERVKVQQKKRMSEGRGTRETS